MFESVPSMTTHRSNLLSRDILFAEIRYRGKFTLIIPIEKVFNLYYQGIFCIKWGNKVKLIRMNGEYGSQTSVYYSNEEKFQFYIKRYRNVFVYTKKMIKI